MYLQYKIILKFIILNFFISILFFLFCSLLVVLGSGSSLYSERHWDSMS
jgi:hypothetical protein